MNWNQQSCARLIYFQIYSHRISSYQRTASTLGSSRSFRSLYSNPFLFSLADACQFPAAWTGLWFQKGVNTIQINQRNMSEKGDCIDQTNYNYVLENR